MNAASPALDRGQLRQIVLISVGAIAIFVFFRFLPTGTNLNHMDFRVDAKNAIEFCDSSNPQFIPVVAVASPVTMSLGGAVNLTPGSPAALTLTLKTANGKLIAPEDLLVAHTKLFHLLIVDPTLVDYQHVHPEPGPKRGEWLFSFTPKRSGVYRVFADFTPAATARGLYASADLNVGPESSPQVVASSGAKNTSVTSNYRFALTPATAVIRAGTPSDLRFTIESASGGDVPMEPVMGAFAHLVAFDATRSGFAHLHPLEADLTRPPERKRPLLNFRITIPTAGEYVIWSQVNLGGQETFEPFRFTVSP